MEGGDGMVAMVRGCGRAGLSVTLFDGGRKYTLMPNQTVNLTNSSQQSCSQNVATQPVMVRNPTVIHQPMTNPTVNYPQNSTFVNNQPMIQQPIHQFVKPQQMQQQQNIDRHNSHHSTMTNTDHDKRDISAQVTDGRYTTVYKMLHCNAKPTSPPEQVTEFPPQRSTLVPGHGNFQVGGVGSCQKQYAASHRQNTFNGAMVWSDRGAVHSPRSARQLDSFASSLRKYPPLSPDKSADVVERLINFSKNSKPKVIINPTHYQQNQGTEASPRTLRDQIRYEECRRLEAELSAIKDECYRSEFENIKSKTYGRVPDVRFCKEANKFGTVNYNSMKKENQGTQQERQMNKDTMPKRLPMSNDKLAVPPSRATSQLSNATVPPQNINSYTTAMETLTNCISIQTLYTPDVALKQQKSVGTTLSSIEFSKCSCQIDLRKTKSEDDTSERDAQKKLYRWFSSMDEDLNGKIIKTKTVLRLKKNISEWGECLKKGIQHVICYKDDSWCSDSDDSYLPITDKNEGAEDSDIEEMIGYLLDKINNSKEIQGQNLHKETIAKLGLKLKEIVQRCKRKKQQTIKEDLLNALYELPLDISQTTKKVYLEDLANSLNEKMKDVTEQNTVKEFTGFTVKGQVQHSTDKTIGDSVRKDADRPKLHSDTFVVLPTQLVKATNHPSLVIKPSKHVIMNTTSEDIKANLVIYIRQLSAKVYEWLECIKNEIPHIEEAKLADAVKNLAEDIVDRLKYRELSAIQSIKTSNENDLEHLKYQIFKWINKYVGEDNLTTLRRAPDLMQKIKTVPIPNILPRSKNLQYDEDSDSSNGMLSKNLMEKVSEVLPIFKNSTIDRANDTTEDGKSNLIIGRRDLKNCSTFLKDPSQSLANNARYMKIANVSTSRTSERACCSAVSPLSAPEIRLNRINDEYFEYLDSWLKRIPIPVSSDSERELANKARMGISNAFLYHLYGLSLDPAKLSNRFYYEDILEDVLDDLFNDLPQVPELVKMRPLLKAELVEKTMSTYELMYKIRDNVSYQQQFVHTVLAMVGTRRRSYERLSDEMEICSFVDEYILSVRYQNDEPERSKWHRERAYKKIETFVEELHKYGKIGDNKSKWAFEIMSALDNVPAPNEEILREEVDRIKLEEEIEDWYLSLPVIDNEEVYERIRRKNLKASLVKKIFDMDREINLGDCAGQRELKYEISRFIEKLPLREDNNLNKNVLINTLLVKLKTRTRQREYEHHSRKSVSFDDVFPVPPCCQQNQHYQTTFDHYDHSLDPPNAPYMDHSVNYSQFHQDVPKTSSYNEQSPDNMSFYTINETRMPPDMKQNMHQTGNVPIPQTDHKSYMFHGSGYTSVPQSPRQDTLHSYPPSNQSYQIPNQGINKSPAVWRNGLHTSQPAGPSGMNRPNPNYTFDSTGQSMSEYPHPGYYKPTYIAGPPVSRMPHGSPVSHNTKDSSITSYFKPSGPPCCDNNLCFKSKGPIITQGPSGMPTAQHFEAVPVTHHPAVPRTPFQYPKKDDVNTGLALSGRASGNLTPSQITVGAQRLQPCSPTAKQVCQVPCQMPMNSRPICTPCQRNTHMIPQQSPQIPRQMSSQLHRPMNPQMSQMHTSMSSQFAQQSQNESEIATTSSGRPLCAPYCSTCTNVPTNKKCKKDKSCLMPGCENPKCKVPKNKRKKIQLLQLQLRKMYQCGGVLDGTGSNSAFECSSTSNVNKNYKCRCMEFYIKKCKKARNSSNLYSNNCSAVLDIPPCLALRSPHPCYT